MTLLLLLFGELQGDTIKRDTWDDECHWVFSPPPTALLWPLESSHNETQVCEHPTLWRI
jgi:hypothetical protein